MTTSASRLAGRCSAYMQQIYTVHQINSDIHNVHGQQIFRAMVPSYNNPPLENSISISGVLLCVVCATFQSF